MKNILLAGAAALIFASCQQAATPEADAKAAEQVTEKPIKAKPVKAAAEDIGNRGDVMMAIQSHDRLEADLENDVPRKAAAVLEFSGVRPGMTVVELEAGSGYYTELLSRIVGKDGKVYMQNPLAFDAFFKPGAFDERLGKDGKRLGNVSHVRDDFFALSAETGSADLVTWILGPHELWLANKEGELDLGTPEDVYAEIVRVLKPGGKLVLLDHKAAPGSPVTTGGDTHRIDPAHVQKFAEDAGLVLEKTSDILASKTDDYAKNVFNPEVRRKTDRFLHMYVKPTH